MLHAAALLTGLCLFWLLATQRWNTVDDVAIALGAGVAVVAFAALHGGVGKDFARAPRAVYASLRRVGAVLSGALSTMRAALAADITLKPGLVRIKTRADDADGGAAFANMISATPGMAVVESEADGLLVHVLNEDSVDPSDLGRLEHMVGGGAR